MNMFHPVQHDTHLSYLCHHTTNQHHYHGSGADLNWNDLDNLRKLFHYTITGHVIKQDGSSPSSKPHMTNEGSEHKYSCVAKINKINAFQIKVATAS